MKLSGFAAGPYNTNSYLLETETSAVVVDPGMHAHDKVLSFLAEKSLELEAIVLTHGHIDHMRDAGTLAKRFTVPVYIHADDAFMLEPGKAGSPQSRMLFDAENLTPVNDVRDLPDGGIIELAGENFHIQHAPGHSPGSVLLIGEEFALTGDVIFRGSVGRSDLAYSDPEAMNRSLRGPVWAMDDRLSLLPGHGPTTTMRAERSTNPFLTSLGL